MDNMDNKINEAIVNYSKELRLPAIRQQFKAQAKEAAQQRMEYETFLFHLLEREYELRMENRKKAHIRQAEFPAKMYLNDLNRELLPKDAEDKIPLLERLDFIESGQNALLAGNPWTGKTRIAVGLGREACMQGDKGFFTTVHQSLTRLREAHASRTLRRMELRFEKYDLVIFDEFGYVSFDRE